MPVSPYTPQTWTDSPATTTPLSAVRLGVIESGIQAATAGAIAVTLVPTAVKTAAYTAAVNDFVPVDTTGANVTVTLPNAPADGARVGIKHVIQGGTNTVTVNCAGTAVFNKTSGSTSMTLTLVNQALIVQYKSSSAIWYIVSDDLPLGGLDGRYPDVYSNGARSTTRVDTVNRLEAGGTITLATQQVQYAMFAPHINLTISNLRVNVGGTAAASATLIRYGLYTIDGSGNLTLVARTASDTTLMGTTNALSIKALDTTGGYPASYALVKGTRYAFAVLQVAGTQAILRAAALNAGMTVLDPRLAAVQTGQSDLPTTVTAGSLGSTAGVIWGDLT